MASATAWLTCPPPSLRSSLSVVDTSLDGGASAVRCLGTGVISAARVICLSRSASLWYEAALRRRVRPLCVWRRHDTYAVCPARRFDVLATDAVAAVAPVLTVDKKACVPAPGEDDSPCGVLTSCEP